MLFLQLPATAVLFTWLHRHTAGSVLIAVVFHAVLNAAGLAASATEGMGVAIARVLVHWLAAGVLVALAGADLDRWPRSGLRKQVQHPAGWASPAAIDSA